MTFTQWLSWQIFRKKIHRPCVTYGKSKNHTPQIVVIPRGYGFQNFDTMFPSSAVFFLRFIEIIQFLIIVFGNHMQYFWNLPPFYWNLPPFFLEFNISSLECARRKHRIKILKTIPPRYHNDLGGMVFRFPICNTGPVYFFF